MDVVFMSVGYYVLLCVFSLYFVIASIVMFVLKYCFRGVLHFFFLGLVPGCGISAYFL
jgi:hypothetical protein